MENVERCIKAHFFCGRMAWQLKFYREALQTLKNNKAKSFINMDKGLGQNSSSSHQRKNKEPGVFSCSIYFTHILQTAVFEFYKAAL